MTQSQPGDVRECIIQEATHLFVSRGYRGISMREIAEAVGVSKAGLYYHFKDKEALFLAILTANLERIEAIVREARSEEVTARGQISRMVRAIFEQSPYQRAIIRLASQEMPHLSQTARAEFGCLYRARFIGQVEDILRAGMEAGELRAMDVSLATWLLLGMMYPFLYPAHEREQGPAQAVIDLLVSVFFDGVTARNV
ncbi:MAG: TetR/AcrR family transcriptional regulator [Anaerolineae bacterium]